MNEKQLSGMRGPRLDRNGIPILDPPGQEGQPRRAKWEGPMQWQSQDYSGLKVPIPNGDCWLCGLPIERKEDRSADHIVPRFMGGTDAPSNIAPAHRQCNAIRGHHAVASDVKTRRVLVFGKTRWFTWADFVRRK